MKMLKNRKNKITNNSFQNNSGLSDHKINNSFVSNALAILNTENNDNRNKN